MAREESPQHMECKRGYPQPHSLNGISEPWYRQKLHHALKRRGYDGSIFECVFGGWAYAPVPVNPRKMNGHRGGIYTRGGR